MVVVVVVAGLGERGFLLHLRGKIGKEGRKKQTAFVFFGLRSHLSPLAESSPDLLPGAALLRPYNKTNPHKKGNPK